MSITMTQSKAIAWSKLDPRPVFWYNDQFQEWFVVWNGIQMIADHALLIAGTNFWNIFPTQEMIRQIEEKFRKLYYANAFNTDSWHGMIQQKIDSNQTMYNYYRWVLQNHISTHLKDQNPPDVLQWFDKYLQR